MGKSARATSHPCSGLACPMTSVLKFTTIAPPQQRKNVEGSLYLLKRRTNPRFQMMVLNKLTTGWQASHFLVSFLPKPLNVFEIHPLFAALQRTMRKWCTAACTLKSMHRTSCTRTATLR